MKVIVITETILGSCTTVSAFVPETGAEYATEESLISAMRTLWEREYNLHIDEIDEEESYFGEDEAVICAKDTTVHFEIVNVEAVVA